MPQGRTAEQPAGAARRQALARQAKRIADRMVLLDRGKFVVSGTVEEMFNSTDPLVRQFVHGLTQGPLTERKKESNYTEDLLQQKLFD